MLLNHRPLISQYTRFALRDEFAPHDEQFEQAVDALTNWLVRLVSEHERIIEFCVELKRPSNRSQRDIEREYVLADICLFCCGNYISQMSARLMRNELGVFPCEGLLDPEVMLSAIQICKVRFFDPDYNLSTRANDLAPPGLGKSRKKWPFGTNQRSAA